MEQHDRCRRKLLIFSLFIAFANAAPAVTSSTVSSTTLSSISHGHNTSSSTFSSALPGTSKSSLISSSSMTLSSTSPGTSKSSLTSSSSVTLSSTSSGTSKSPAANGELITTQISSSSSNPPGVVPPPCLTTGQVCDREGQPTYAYDATPYLNVYYTPGVHNYSPAYSSQVSFCEALFNSSLVEWLHTAPITYGSLLPETTVTEIGVQTLWSTVSIPASIWTTTEFLFFPLGSLEFPGYTTFTTTFLTINQEGVQVTETTLMVGQLTTQTTTADYILEESTTTLTGATAAYTQAAYSPAGFLTDFTYVPTSPCCKQCTLFGGNVQVYYWPSVTASPKVSTLVNSEKFTFISPSIYVAFQSLYATDFCGTLGGDFYTATTLAFRESDLSTATGYFWNSAEYSISPPFLPPLYTAAKWADQKECTDVTVSFYQYALSVTIEDKVWDVDYSTYSVTQTAWGFSGETSTPVFTHYTVTYNPCSPTLSVPTELFTLNPQWSTCSQGIAGLFDPPYALSTGNGLAAFNTVTSVDPITDIPVTTSAPAAGQTIPPVTPSATQTPSSIAPATSLSIAPASPIKSSTVVDPPPAQSPSNNPLPVATVSKSNDPPIQATQTAANPASTSAAISIGSQTLVPGGPQVTITGTTYSLQAGGSSVVINGVTQALSVLTTTSNYLVASQTLVPGGPAITVSGQVVSLQAGGSSVVVGGSTQALSAFVATTSAYVVGSQTLVPGGAAITVSGQVVSLQAGGSSVVIGGSTQALSAFVATTSAYVVGSQTLVPGGAAITVSGQVVSLQAAGSNVVIGGKTEPLSAFLGTSTTEVGLGVIIATIGGFGTPAGTTVSHTSVSGSVQSPSSAFNGTVLSSAGGKLGDDRSLWLIGGLLVMEMLGICCL